MSVTRFKPVEQAPPLHFDIPVVTPRLIVPRMLPNEGPLMKLWRNDPVAQETHRIDIDYHVGFDMVTGEIATIVQPCLTANPPELPA